jgi:hypothetical protein
MLARVKKKPATCSILVHWFGVIYTQEIKIRRTQQSKKLNTVSASIPYLQYAGVLEG